VTASTLLFLGLLALFVLSIFAPEAKSVIGWGMLLLLILLVLSVEGRLPFLNV
jgi:hypothetical protein